MRKVILASLIAAAAFLPLAGSAAPRSADDDTVGDRVMSVAVRQGQPNRNIKLGLNKAVIIQLDTDAKDVLVSNPKIVDAVVRSPRRIFLLGMSSGTTNAFIFDAAGHQILSVEIAVQRDLSDVSSLIRASMPGSDIHVTGAADGVVLTGTVSSAIDAMKAQNIAERFVDDPKKVVNMIAVKAHEQVMLRVRIAEMARTVSKQFGINLSAAAFGGNMPVSASTGNAFGLVGRALSDLSGAQVGQICTQKNGLPALPGAGCSNVEGQLKALEEVGLVHTLAEPNLTAVSGETAKFLAGGEFPVPASRDRDGNVTVEFKQFGVGLSFTPVVLSENRISLQVSTEVSEISNVGSFTLAGSSSTDPTTGQVTTVQGLTIPGLSVRRAETTVELPSGGSFAIAGLMQHQTKQVIDQFPGIGNLPVLGALFRSRDFQNNETEMVVLISAYLVNPAAESKFVAPTDGFVAATDPDTLFMDRINGVYKRNTASLKSAAAGPTGYIIQ